MNPDVVVIGAGIVGCSCAYYLAQSGLKVHLIDKGSVGSGASKAGMMHIVTWEEPEIHLKLARRSKELYAELQEQLLTDINFRLTGSIAIVEKPESMAGFAKTLQHLQTLNVRSELLNGEDLVKMEPNIAPDVAGGAYFPDDAQVNPLYATLALTSAARALGATIDSFNEVTGFEMSDNNKKVSAVLTTKGRIPTNTVVISAGAWSSEIGRMAGLMIPVKPRKGTLVVTVPVPDDLMKCKVILAASYMDSVKGGATSSVAVAANVQQAKNGNLVLGSSRQFIGFDHNVDPIVVALMLKRCLRFFPVLANISSIRTWAGFRPYTPDLIPIISRVDQIDGIFVATGHEGIGITEGPITGKLICQMITGQTPEIPIDELNLSRFNQQ
ncbi:MAG: FAD-binding oxidoreductase [Anaerolineaceae bacterium]|nr:FAD-binding oxidoreductase [Anaerolineaceae bacterium]